MNTKYWNIERFEVPISNGSVLEWSVIAITIAMVTTILKPNHWKSQQIGQFIQFQMVLDKIARYSGDPKSDHSKTGFIHGDLNTGQFVHFFLPGK